MIPLDIFILALTDTTTDADAHIQQLHEITHRFVIKHSLNVFKHDILSAV